MSSNQQEGFANPAPAGLVALAIACFAFFAVLSGSVGHSAIPLLGCWLLGGFIVQIVVAYIELKEGQLLGGNVFLVFAAFFMFTGSIEFFVKAYFNTVGGTPIDTQLDGYCWLVLLIILLLWTPAYLKTASAIMGLLVIFLDLGVFFVAFSDLKIMSGGVYAAYSLLITGIIGIYIAAAIQLNAAFGRTILPLPGPMIK
ncbi:MAG: GPR1/FUN34/YaaH family transporter [Syntrophomonadaceae bacterium]|jgi:succinate-acetate transporter protein|nr:GPR1/FUN34/YaaH family transporter [Syntrophomonadaceae bacterium]